MIIGVGIDAVEISRFADWHSKSLARLRRIFSEPEIVYCLQNPAKSAERFAARFAAREAVYKVLHAHAPIPFLTLARAITITKGQHGKPALIIDWQLLSTWDTPLLRTVHWHLSLTHTNTTSIACIIGEVP